MLFVPLQRTLYAPAGAGVAKADGYGFNDHAAEHQAYQGQNYRHSGSIAQNDIREIAP